MPSFTVKIVNRLGLHARAAGSLVALGKTFDAEVALRRGDRCVNGKSIMSVMLLEASAGCEVEVTVSGPDADPAAAAIRKLIERGFDEDTAHG